MTEDAPPRDYPLRETFNGLRWMARTGAPWRLIANDLPPWRVVYEQAHRWIAAGCFGAIVHDLRELLRVAGGRKPQPTAAILDGRPLQSTPESGGRAGYDSRERGQSGLRRSQKQEGQQGPHRRGHAIAVDTLSPWTRYRRGHAIAVDTLSPWTRYRRGHAIAVDTLGHLRAVHVTPANEQERAQVGELAAQVQAATEQSVTLAYVDQGYTEGDTGDAPAGAAKAAGMDLEVIKLPGAKRGFVLLPRRWVVGRSFAWATRFRRLAKDYERLPETLAGLHFAVFAILMLTKAAPLLKSA